MIILKETEINDPEEKVRNVSNIGHHGIGDYEYNIFSEEDPELIKMKLLLLSFIFSQMYLNKSKLWIP